MVAACSEMPCCRPCSWILSFCCLSPVSNQSAHADLWPLASRRHFPPTQLPLTGYSLLFGPSFVNPRDGCASAKIPVDQQFVKRSDLRPRPAPNNHLHQSPKSLQPPCLRLPDSHFELQQVVFARLYVTKCCELRALGSQSCDWLIGYWHEQARVDFT